MCAEANFEKNFCLKKTLKLIATDKKERKVCLLFFFFDKTLLELPFFISVCVNDSFVLEFGFFHCFFWLNDKLSCCTQSVFSLWLLLGSINLKLWFKFLFENQSNQKPERSNHLPIWKFFFKHLSFTMGVFFSALEKKGFSTKKLHSVIASSNWCLMIRKFKKSKNRIQWWLYLLD